MQIEYSSSYCIATNYKPEFIEFLIHHFSYIGQSESFNKNQHDMILRNGTGYFKEIGSSVWFYSGFLLDIIRSYNAEKINISSDISIYTTFDFDFENFLYEHQKKILTAIFKKKRGLIQSPTGSGKSFIIAECVRRFYNEGLSTVITVPTIDLLNQLKKDIHEYFKLCKDSIPEKAIGLIGGGNKDYNPDKYKIHIGIPQSLCKLKNTKALLNKADVLLADEVHTTANVTYAAIIKESINNKIRIGLSATPWTNNEHNILLKAFFGNLICKIEEADMITNKVIMEPKFYFYNSPSGFLPKKLEEFAYNIGNLGTGHRYKVLNQVYNYLILNNSGRNKMIVDLAIARATKDLGPVIIIVNKVNDAKGKIGHATILKTMFESQGKFVKVISGTVKKKDRVSIIEDLKQSKLDIVIAGPKVLTAGISIPSLSTIVLAGAGKSDTDLIQRIGRLLRKQEGKDQPLVIDFIDSQFWFNNQSYTRMNIIKSVYGEKYIYVI